ncbi:MAG: hypothetical protein IPH18_07435 [Chitinophagaceae bacterium]|nr:hypothetical protein [Chitinophagaceae bacterium]
MLEKTSNGHYRWIDSLSFRPDMEAEKFVVNVRHIKLSMQEAYRVEGKRSVTILGKLKGKFWERLSFSVYEMMWDGSDQVVVNIRNLADGFASLKPTFTIMPMMAILRLKMSTLKHTAHWTGTKELSYSRMQWLPTRCI